MERVLEPEVMDTADEAESYDAMDHAEPNASFVERLLELGAAGRMLDIGTGPGHVPLLVCERRAGAEVVGVDLSGEMLKIAERHRAASPHAARIEYRLGDAKGLDFGAGVFDTVYSNTILHHIPDPRPFLREAWRVLRPGGCLLIRDLFRPESPEQVEALVQMHAATADAQQQALFAASLCAAFTPAELQGLAAECGLEGAVVVIDSDRHMSLQKTADPA